jgi:hypothetical protein
MGWAGRFATTLEALKFPNFTKGPPMEPKSALELERDLMTHHASEYVAFTRTLLTTSAGTLALLAGLATQRATSLTPVAETAFRVGWLCLCTSLLCGLALQWLVVLQPLNHANLVKSQNTAAAAPLSPTSNLLRRRPQRRAQWFLFAQVAGFVSAFAALTVAMMRL